MKRNFIGVNKRRIRAKKRLEENLSNRQTTLKNLNATPEDKQGERHIEQLVDTERHIARIQFEITNLSGKILPSEMAILKRTKRRRG